MVQASFSIQSRLIDFEDDGATPVHAVACPRTLCSDAPMWARLVDFDPDGTEIWDTAPDCNEYPVSENGFYGFVHADLWPPYGIPRTIGVHYRDTGHCGNITATELAVYDDTVDGWIGGGGFFAYLSAFGVLTIIQGGCVDPAETWSFGNTDVGVCIYPLGTPLHEITSIIGSGVSGENGGCCLCGDAGTTATFTVQVVGFSDGVRACRLVDYEAGGTEVWESGSCCTAESGALGCCESTWGNTLTGTTPSVPQQIRLTIEFISADEGLYYSFTCVIILNIRNQTEGAAPDDCGIPPPGNSSDWYWIGSNSIDDQCFTDFNQAGFQPVQCYTMYCFAFGEGDPCNYYTLYSQDTIPEGTPARLESCDPFVGTITGDAPGGPSVGTVVLTFEEI